MNAEVARVALDSGHPTIAVNNTFKLAPSADMVYAADDQWWRKYYKEAEHCTGRLVSCSPVAFPNVLVLKNTGNSGFDKDPSCIRTGGNSGYQAIHIAAHAGAKRIVLCGFDLRGGHWHGRHVSPLREHGEGIYARWIPRFNTLAVELERLGIEVINCTPGSALKCWPNVPLNQVLELALA
jgi:hypothetical protein